MRAMKRPSAEALVTGFLQFQVCATDPSLWIRRNQRLEPSGYDKRRSTKLETTRDDQTKFETTRNVPNRYKATSGVHSKSPIDTTRSLIASGHTQTTVWALPSQNSSLCLKRTRGDWRVVEVRKIWGRL